MSIGSHDIYMIFAYILSLNVREIENNNKNIIYDSGFHACTNVKYCHKILVLYWTFQQDGSSSPCPCPNLTLKKKKKKGFYYQS